MPLTQNAAIELILAERRYQDKTFNPQSHVASGYITRQQRDLDITPHLVMLTDYTRKATKAWTDQRGPLTINGEEFGGSLPALRQVAKIAAIALRALEVAGGSEELLKAGLRDTAHLDNEPVAV